MKLFHFLCFHVIFEMLLNINLPKRSYSNDLEQYFKFYLTLLECI